MLSQFANIAPFLTNPAVLIGFCLLLSFSVHRLLLRSRLLQPIPARNSFTLLDRILKYGFVLSLAIIILGFAVASFHEVPSPRGQSEQFEHNFPPVIQETGSCGNNVSGDNNKTSVDCSRSEMAR